VCLHLAQIAAEFVYTFAMSFVHNVFLNPPVVEIQEKLFRAAAVEQDK